MRKHYYLEVLLLFALSCTAASLAADHHFYETIFDAFHICSVADKAGELTISTECASTVISWIRIYSFLLTVLLVAANVLKYLHSEKRLVHWLLVSIHNTFFSHVEDMQDVGKQNIYRVTCYKYYRFSVWPILITFLMGVLVGYFYFALSTGQVMMIRVGVVCILIVATSIILLGLFDSWWYQWAKRIFLKDRHLKPGNTYLLGYSRYGFENGRKNEKPTTLPFLVDPAGDVYRLFVGTVFRSKNRFEIRCNNHQINSVLSEVPMSENKVKSLKEYIYKSVEINYRELKGFSAFSDLDQPKRHYVRDFMTKTNTMAWDLFVVNGRKHCNHFVGFKVMSNGGNTWGVVTIDVLDETLVAGQPKTFLGILHRKDDEDWLTFTLESFSEIFSNTLNPEKNRRPNN